MPTAKISTLASRTPEAPDLAENVPFRKGSQSAHPKNSGISQLAATVIEFPAAQFSERCGYKNPPRRRSNRATRTREHLTSGEIEKMISVALRQGGRTALRDSLLIREAERHGLRAKELVELRWDQFNFDDDTLYVTRAKHGSPGTHYLKADEKAALRKWQRQQGGGAFVFTALGGNPITTRSVHRVFAAVGQAAGIPFPVHPHQARHATGYRLVNEGVDTRTIQGFLGHRSIHHTVRYTELAPDRFKGL